MSDEEQNTRIIFGAFFDHHRDTNPFPFECEWDEFTTLFQEPQIRERKDPTPHDQDWKENGPAPLYSLARFVAKDGKIARQNKYVDLLSGIVLDFDKNFDIDAIVKRLEGVAFLAHTTYSHWLADAKHPVPGPRWRVVIPLSVPIRGENYKAARAWLMKFLNEGKQAKGKVNEVDTTAAAFSTPYFMPAAPARLADKYEALVGDGPFIELPSMADFIGGTPQARILSSKADWAWLKAKMRTHKNEELRKPFQAVLKGRSFSEHGNRDNLLTRMCGALAGWAPGVDAEELAKIFIPSLEVMTAEHPDDPPPSFELTIDKIQRAQDGLQQDAREHNTYVAEKLTTEVALPDVEEEGAQLDERAQAVGLPDADELRKRLILRGDKSLWVWDTGLDFWRGPMSDAAAQMFARQELGKVPGVSVWMRKSGDEGLRLKVLPELSHDHGVVLRTVSMDLRVTMPSYDVVNDKLVLVGAPRRPLEAQFDDFVDAWLRALGGNREERILDWVASLTWLKRPNSILFLRGTPDVGKGLLMRGLSRVWEVDAPTNMQRLLEAHGDFELTRCPLVVIDEGGKRGRFVDMTSILREYVTQPSRTFNRKHHDPIEITGYLRFIISANNFNIFANDQHSLTPEDRDAIAQRFLEITPSFEAGKLLLSIDDDERASLVEEDRIARHALWLSENREVKSHGRFIVPGDASNRFAIRIVTEDHKWGSWVIEWLARYLSNPKLIEQSQNGLLSRAGGRVIVSPEAVVNTFESFLKNKQRPQSLEISNVLKSLSTGKDVKLPNGRGYGYEILIEEVIAWSREKHIGDPERIRENAMNQETKKPGGNVVAIKGAKNGNVGKSVGGSVVRGGGTIRRKTEDRE
jgi:hypothetical protein